MGFFLLSYFKAVEIWKTNTDITFHNYFHYLPAKPYTIQTSHQFSKFLLNRAGQETRQLWWGNPIHEHTLDPDFSDTQVPELLGLGQHPPGIVLNAKV